MDEWVMARYLLITAIGIKGQGLFSCLSILRCLLIELFYNKQYEMIKVILFKNEPKRVLDCPDKTSL